MISRRHVFHLGGYDPVAPETLFARFRRSLSSFQKNWNVTTTASDLTTKSDVSATWHAEASGANWKTQTTFEILRWDDLILQDFQRDDLSRLGHAALTLLDFIVTGTLVRYLRSSWRYTAFFLFPYCLVTLFAVLGLCAASLTYRLFGPGGGSGALATLVAVAVFGALLRWSPWRQKINHAFDDWIFSRQFLYGQRLQMEQRIDAFAEKIVERAGDSDADEIIVVGHCLGAALVMQAVARAMKKDARLAEHGPKICILTVGATIPKFSLHPRGEIGRRATASVAQNSLIPWSEYHARDDMISFYRFDPVTLTHIAYDRSDGRPNIRRVQILSMLSADSFRRNRFRFMRIHYQFLMGNDQRSAYDYCMIVCGPLPFEEITGPAGGLPHFGVDGALLASDPAQTKLACPAQAASSVNVA